jgi:alpha-tubulin suppressor-like RCC1 family protein
VNRGNRVLAILAPLVVAAGLLASGGPASATAYSGSDWKTISAGDSTTCGIRANGKLYCWNTDGTGSSLYSISGYSDWKSVSVGRSHQCAIRGKGYLYCWGDDTYGQVGNGSTTGNPTSPVRVAGSSTSWTSVSAGATHTCGILGGGYLYCWGDDTYGQLGNGSTAGSQIGPVRVAGSSTSWKSVSAGDAHTCGILGGGYSYCWGDDTYGQLGNGSDTSRQSPGRINSGWYDWTSIRAGGSHTCGLRGAGYLYCWGDDTYHQVGGSTNPQQSPHWYGSLTDWTATDTGQRFSCGIRGAGYLYCWGAQQAPSNGTPAGSAYPADLSSVGHLNEWKVTLPVDGSDADTYADEVTQPQLATYRSLSYFHTNSNNSAVVLRAPVGGATTPGSVFARTELRNMYPYDGVKAATYNWTSGTHVLEINEAFTHLPSLIPKVVGVQIHDPDHEVLMIRLDGTRLYAQVRQLDGTYTEVTFTNSYTLGTRFDAKVTADANGIFIDYNGVRMASFPGRVPSSTVYWYFKAGCYLHSKTSAGEAPSEYGEVLIYSLKTTHS